MAQLILSIKLFSIYLLLFLASSNDFVNSAAVQHGGARCGRGLKKCDEGFKCVRKENLDVRTCQKISSLATPTSTHSPFSSSERHSFPSASASSSSLTRHTSRSTLKPVTRSSGSTSNRASIKSSSPPSPPPSKRSDGLPPPGSTGHTPNHSESNTGKIPSRSSSSSTGKPPSRSGSSTGKPPSRTGSSTGKPPSRTGSSTGKPPSRSGSSTGKPPSRSGSSTGKPPSRTGSSTGKPPSRSGSSTGKPPSRSGSSTSRPTTTRSPSNPPNSAKNITAVVGVTGKIVERRPIDVLQKDYPDVFNLLILAFESIQKRDESEDLSYYQLSGIHGYPFISWQYPPKNPAPQLGYCTHASAIFTTWHRPYVLLLEQIIYEEAVSIAKRFTGPNASKYQAAAEEVRLPYWDWASDETDSHLPKAAVDATISVVKPGSAGPATIPNPLYNYRRRTRGGPTVRADTAEADLVATFAERQSLTNALFTATSYNAFSFDLEDIHNLVHVLIGGDMVDIAISAFDPIFWLHHTNVDRLMAIYQASHPNVYLTPAPRTPTYALSGPGPDDLSTPLYPFRHPDAREWTSDDVKTAESIFKYGYAYPEVPSGQTGDDLRTFAIQRVNELYGPKTEDRSLQGEESGVPDQSGARREWNANVVVDKTEIPGSQQIRLFIGKNDSRSFSTDDLAGVAAVFSSNLTAETSANRFLNITVPLTQTLVDKNVGLRPEDVVPKLANDLHWVVEQAGDTKSPIPVQDLKSLQVSVSSQVAEYPDDKTKLPVKSESETFVGPTKDKIGGLTSGETPPVGKLASNPPISKLS